MLSTKVDNDLVFYKLTYNSKNLLPIENLGYGTLASSSTALINAGEYGKKYNNWPRLDCTTYGKTNLSKDLSRNITWGGKEEKTYTKLVNDINNEIFKSLLSNNSFVFNCIGSSGSGKTFLIRNIIDKFTSMNFYEKMLEYYSENYFSRDLKSPELKMLKLFKDSKMICYIAEQKLLADDAVEMVVRKKWIHGRSGNNLDNISKIISDETKVLYESEEIDNEYIRKKVNQYIRKNIHEKNDAPRLHVNTHDENDRSSRSILYYVFTFILSENKIIEVVFIDNIGFENISNKLYITEDPLVYPVRMNIVDRLIDRKKINESLMKILDLKDKIQLNDPTISSDIINQINKKLYVNKSAEGLFGYLTATSYYSIFSGDSKLKLIDDDYYYDILDKIIKNNNYIVLNVLQLNDSIENPDFKRRDFLLYLSFFNRVPISEKLFYL